MTEPMTLAVLVSGGGTTLQNLIDLIGAGHLKARIGVVIGSRGEILAVERARTAKIASFVVEPKAFGSIEEFSEKIFAHCSDAGADLICLAGWLSLLKVPEGLIGRVMNIHPALLPSPFGGKGMYGQRVHQAVIDYGCKVSGCTVHFVDNDYDNGPIIVQKVCAVMEDDSVATLAARVADLEREAYPEAIKLFAEGRLAVEGRRVRVLPADRAPE